MSSQTQIGLEESSNACATESLRPHSDSSRTVWSDQATFHELTALDDADEPFDSLHGPAWTPSTLQSRSTPFSVCAMVRKSLKATTTLVPERLNGPADLPECDVCSRRSSDSRLTAKPVNLHPPVSAYSLPSLSSPRATPTTRLLFSYSSVAPDLTSTIPCNLDRSPPSPLV